MFIFFNSAAAADRPTSSIRGAAAFADLTPLPVSADGLAIGSYTVDDRPPLIDDSAGDSMDEILNGLDGESPADRDARTFSTSPLPCRRRTPERSRAPSRASYGPVPFGSGNAESLNQDMTTSPAPPR